MSRTSSAPRFFHADHIGSLLRPADLRRAFHDAQSGTLGESGFRDIQDSAIRDIVKLQEEVGFELVTDGEFRRASYWGRFVERVQGVGVQPAHYTFHDDHGHETQFIAPYIEDKVKRTQPLAADEVTFTSSVTSKIVKVTLPAPSTLHFWRGNDYAKPGVYANAAEFFDDLGRVFQAEIAECAANGARYIQLDEVALVVLCDDSMRARLKADGVDPAQLAQLYIDAINQAVANRPPGVLVGVHICRGNFKGKYLSEGGYDWLAETLFQNANVDHFLLEYDTPRAGDFAPLRFLPKDKGVVLGLVSSKSPQLESSNDLKTKIDDAARYVGIEQLGISPQCGFASTVAGNPVTQSDMRAKLKLVVDTARAVWG